MDKVEEKLEVKNNTDEKKIETVPAKDEEHKEQETVKNVLADRKLNQQNYYNYCLIRDSLALIFLIYIFLFKDILGIRSGFSSIFLENSTENNSSEEAQENLTNILNETESLEIDLPIEEVIEKIIILQPHCTWSEVFDLLIEDFINTTRYDADGRLRSSKVDRNKGDMVLHIILLLMLVSLGATIWELIQARCVQKKDKQRKTLSRKCSLADLTVLRHDRKELRRKESSIIEDTLLESAKGIGGIPYNPSRMPTTQSLPRFSVDNKPTNCTNNNNISYGLTIPIYHSKCQTISTTKQFTGHLSLLSAIHCNMFDVKPRRAFKILRR